MIAVDWYITIIFLIGLIVLGIWLTRYVRSMADFLVAGRKVRKFLGLGSQRAESVGLSSIAGYAQQGFLHGFAFLWVGILTKLWTIPLFGIFGFGIKRFRASGCITIAQYTEERYKSKGLRILIGFVLAVSGIINMSIFPKVGSNFLLVFTGLPESFIVGGMAVSTAFAIMVILLTLAVFFTFLGGMVTVIVTDFIQAIIIIGTLVFVGCSTVFKAGPSAIHQSLDANLGQAAYNPFNSNSYGLTWILWIFLLSTFLKFAHAPEAQKMASSDSPETARKMELISAFFSSGQTIFLLLLGIGAMVMFGVEVPAGVDAEGYHRFIAAIYLREALPPVMMGIALAAMLFASISTDDSYLLAWSTVIINDIVLPLKKEHFTAKAHMRAIRIAIVSIAAIMLLWSSLYKANESILEYMYISGTIMAGVGISVVFGLYWRRATSAGAYAAIIVCVIVPLSDIIGKQFIDNYPLTTQQSGLYAMVGGILAIIIVSLLTGKGDSAGWVDYGKVFRKMETEESMRISESKRGHK